MNEGWNSQRSCKTWAKNTTPELFFFFCFCFLLFFLFDSLIWDFFVFRSTSEKTKPLWADLKTRTSERMTKPLLWQRSLRRDMWVLSLVNIRNVVTYKQHDDVVRRLSAGRQTQEKGGSHSGLDRHRTRLRWRGFVHRQLRGCESVSSRTFGLLKNYWLINQRQIIHPGLFLNDYSPAQTRGCTFCLVFLQIVPKCDKLSPNWNQICLLVSVVWRVRAGLHHDQVRWILHKFWRAAVPPGFRLGGPTSSGNTRALKSKKCI